MPRRFIYRCEDRSPYPPIITHLKFAFQAESPVLVDSVITYTLVLSREL